jgi:hypothetical protein
VRFRVSLAAALYNRDYVAEVVDAVRNITAPASA